MGTFTPHCLLLEFDPEGDPRRPWRTARRHDYETASIRLSVPAGFRTDLASVPRFLLWLVDPLGKHQRAAVFHDSAYAFQYTTRFEADAIFRSILEADGVTWLRVWGLYYAVRIFGGEAWEANRPNVWRTRLDFDRTYPGDKSCSGS